MISQLSTVLSQPKHPEKPVLLRLPQNQVKALDKIVKSSKGKYRSRNELVIIIIDVFLRELRNKAEAEVKSGG